MTTLGVDPEDPSGEAIARAAAVIRAGGLVAFPTETVYGLGASALDAAAVDRIYLAKGRPDYNPLIVHVVDAAAARPLVVDWPVTADQLARAFWPGPLTLVLARSERVPARVSAGLPTVAVRVPDHPVALALLRAADVPIVAPSANPSMAVSPTRAEHVERGLGGRVDLILDGGPTRVGIESTVVDLTGERAVLLRPGAVTIEDLERMLGDIALPRSAPEGAPRSSPGMLARHYAPRAEVELFDPSDQAATAALMARARRVSEGDGTVAALLLAGPDDGGAEMAVEHIIRLPFDPAAYARELYSVLHRVDELGCDLLLVEAVPPTPAWAGVRDRLSRAARNP